MPKDNTERESDVARDKNVAGSRAGKDGQGRYVGRISADDSFDTEETGAEARRGENKK